jgi:hypothetical protein
MSNTGDKPGRVEITVPETYHQKTDDSVWEEIETYLFRGFLTCNAVIQNQFFVFKTLNHHELEILNFMKPFSKSRTEIYNYWRSAFISYSVFMINGNNVLPDREKHITKLMKTISRFSTKELERIFENLLALNDKVLYVYPLTEVYSFESRSRFKWLQLSIFPLNSVQNTGIVGTDNLGMNYSQMLWTSLNKIQDSRDESEANWNNAKFIGSTMAGKGIKSVDERDRARAERERTDREELKLKVLKNYLNRTAPDKGISNVEKINMPDGRIAEVVSRHRADTAEELAQQLSAALSGEKDAHDLAVEAHFKKTTDRRKEIDQERRLILTSVQRENPLPEGSSVMTKSEADERIRRLREMMIKSSAPITPNIENSSSDK